jgi:redox-sensing transcriptional repressor
VEPNKIGKKIHGIEIFPLEALPHVKGELGIEIAILTVPSTAAQEVAEQIVRSGITAIWNFTNVKLKVPSQVIVQQEDLSSGYAVLTVKIGAFHTNPPS